MSRVVPNHVFLLAEKPEHPLAPSGLKGWTVERTELEPTGYMPDGNDWIDNVTFVHYVSPPNKREFWHKT